MKERVPVVGAVIVRDGLVLCAQRGPTSDQPGLWEFPGGKVEDGEDPTAALEREIREELRCQIEVGAELTTTTHEYEEAVVTLTTFYCRLVDGEPLPGEHSDVAWLDPADLDGLEWAPADLPAVALVRTRRHERGA